MLQTDAVRNLQYDSEIRVAQQNTTTESAVTETQPRREHTDTLRIPLPIATVNGNRTFIPLSGYDCLADLPSVHIEQTFELNDSLTAISSENRYVIRSPFGDAIYSATESSTDRNRMCWGSSRPFQMHLLDRTHQEAMVLHKPFALGAFCCQAKIVEVWTPPGNLLGRIKQAPAFTQPQFFIEDGETNQPIFCIEGPKNAGFCCFCLAKDCYFKIHSGGALRASIDHKWMPTKSQYITNIYFSDTKLTAKERSLILGGAFLLEYMYFQS